MAVVYMAGFESQDATIEAAPNSGAALSLQGTCAFSTLQARTGAASLRCNPASGAQGVVGNMPNTSNSWVHFGFYIAALPTLDRQVWPDNSPSAGGLTLRLTSTGALALYINTSLIGSTAALTVGRWYWIGIRNNTGTSVSFLQVDGSDAITGTATVSVGWAGVGCVGTEASAIDVYYDDVVEDSAGFLAPSRVGLLLPTADSAVGTGWTLGTGTATGGNAHGSVDNEPPTGVADLTAGSDPKQIRNATANANSNYDATMTTYAAAGLTPQDTVLAVQPIVATAAPVTTSSKQGTVGVVSNPTITNVALTSAVGTAGAFWAGAAGGTYPTGWKASWGTLTTSPTVTVATAPVMRITQVTSSTRIAVVCFMGIYVAWTPGALGVIDEPGVFPGRGPRNVSQGINRPSSY